MQRLLTVLILLFGVTPAWAAPASVAILPIECPDEGAATRLDAELREAVSAATDMTAHERVAMTVEEVKLSFSCFEAADACMSQVGSRLKVDRLLWGRLVPVGSEWSFELRLIDVRSKRALRTIKVRSKGPQDFPFLTTRLRSFVLNREVPQAPVQLQINSRPSDAGVHVDGRFRGRTPLTLQVPQGNRSISVSKSGFVSQDQIVRVGDRPKLLELRLVQERTVPMVSSEPVEASRRTLWIGVGLTGLAVGAATLGLVSRSRSATLADEAGRLGPGDAYNRKKADYDSAVLTGNISLGIAGLSAVGAAVAFVMYGTSREGQQVGVQLSPAGLGVVGWF